MISLAGPRVGARVKMEGQTDPAADWTIWYGPLLWSSVGPGTEPTSMPSRELFGI